MSETDSHPSPPALQSPEPVEWKPGIGAALRDAIERNKSAAAHEAAAFRRGLERAVAIIEARENDGTGIDYACRVLATAIRAEITAHANPLSEKRAVRTRMSTHQRLQDAAERIRQQYVDAFDEGNDSQMQDLADAAERLGLTIGVDRDTGEVTVSRAPREG